MMLKGLLGLATLPLVSAQNSTACNNSPALCSRRYDEVTYLGAHDSPFLRDESTSYSVSGNQYYNSTVQLSAGVRLLTAQIHYPPDSTELHVCHTLCQLLDAGTLSGWLGEIKAWMDENLNEVVTILVVNSVGANASELASAYAVSGLASYAYTPASTIAANEEWPTLQKLIDDGTRAVSFVASLDDNTAAPYLLDEFTYIFENAYDVVGASDFSCQPDRPSSLVGEASLAISRNYLSLMNHFKGKEVALGISIPDEDAVNVTNSPSGGAGNLGDHARMCSSTYGRAPNFVLVDFFNVGPAVRVADALNEISPVGCLAVSMETRPPPLTESGARSETTASPGIQSAADGRNESAGSAEVAGGVNDVAGTAAQSPKSCLGVVLVVICLISL
ncbi:unnamed protein product [Zymoseptoria tritici ST99CH_1A5]|uniref:Phosphatidylinositol-specific phospholipase C X domain-containing protein n=1 Tax=Zymoseptoria tritici ST99CH_1A5 TaxID=1276529 RepID=A0A1Y6LDN4_ZYMTR|nr:unnamed protein product [Zymoseptoria tritici ST99CH_1A5]